MNTYDFDETILYGDSEIYFIELVFNKYPKAIKHTKAMKRDQFLYKHHLMSGNRMWTKRYRYLFKYIENIDEFLKELWDLHEKDIKPYYLNQRKDDDIIISATPRFILEPIMQRIGNPRLIATEFDVNKIHVIGKVDKGEEKVRRFYKEFGKITPDTFYSDSDSDTPMAKIAKKAYRVIDFEIKEWEF